MTHSNDVRRLTRRDFVKLTAPGALTLATVRSSLAQGSGTQNAAGRGTADWPRFGCDLHNTRFNAAEKMLGRDNVGRLKLKWTFDADGPIQTTPTVVGDTVYFGASSGHQYALDAKTGALRWKFFAGFDPDPNAANQGVRSSCQYADGRLYFGTGFAKVHCLDAATGRELWQRALDDKPAENRAQILCAPAVFEGKVYIGTSSGRAQAVCLDAETGAVRWRFDVVPMSEHGAGSIWTSGAVDEQQRIVYFGTGSNKTFYPPGPMLFTESMIALDMDTGALLWYDQARPASPYDLDYSCHPMIFDARSPSGRSTRYSVGGGNKAGFYCYDRFTGESQWKVMLTPGGAGSGPRLNSTAVAYNRVYVLSNATGVKGRKAVSVTAALHAYTGEILWWVANPSTNQAPVAIANGVFYQGLEDGRLDAIDAETGEELWTFTLPSMHRGGIAIANGALYTSNGSPIRWKPDPSKKYSVHAFGVDGTA